MKLIKALWRWWTTLVGFVAWGIWDFIKFVGRGLTQYNTYRDFSTYLVIVIGSGLMWQSLAKIDSFWLGLLVAMPLYFLVMEVVNRAYNNMTRKQLDQITDDLATGHTLAMQTIAKKYDLDVDELTQQFVIASQHGSYVNRMKRLGYDVEVDVETDPEKVEQFKKEHNID